jgi:hypothetical protein
MTFSLLFYSVLKCKVEAGAALLSKAKGIGKFN